MLPTVCANPAPRKRFAVPRVGARTQPTPGPGGGGPRTRRRLVMWLDPAGPVNFSTALTKEGVNANGSVRDGP